MPDRHDVQLHRSLDPAGDPVTLGWIEVADGSGGRVWADPGSGSPAAVGMVPYYIPVGEDFTVPLYRQALFAEAIEADGGLIVDGLLIGVD